MLVGHLNTLFRILSFERFRAMFHNLLLSTYTETEKGVVFHKESRVFNIQNNKSKISVGKSTHIRGELLIYGHGGEIRIGDYCYFGEGSRIWSALKVTIGNRVLIAHNVNIHDNISHPVDPLERHGHFRHIIEKDHPRSGLDLKEKAVLIDDDAWIGFNATVLRGTHIGKGAIVGACAVVTEDVPDYAIVVGNPARIIGYADDRK